MGDVIEILTTATNTVEVEAQGPQGAPGVGVPTGGSALQILRKKSNADYDTEWATGGGGGGVSSWNDLADKPATFPPSAHTHSISEVTNLQTALDGKAATNHTHVAANVTDFNTAAAAAAPVQSVAGRTGAVTLAVGDVANAVATDDARLSDSRIPTAHSASHAASGSDPVSPSSIGAQSIFTTSAIVSGTTLSAARAVNYIVSNYGSAYDIVLPITGSLQGDVAVFRTDNFMAAAVTIKYPATPSNVTIGTLTAVDQQLRFQYNAVAQEWNLVRVDSHPADRITSGNFGNISYDGKVGSDAGRVLVTTTAGAVTTLALGAAGTVLTVNGTADGVEFAAASGGGVTTGSVDNAIIRADGTGGSTSQSSDLVIDDAVVAYAITGDASTDIITAVGHNYTANQAVRFQVLAGGSGLNNTATYFVRDISGDTFKVSTSSGGAAVNFTTNITGGSIVATQPSVAIHTQRAIFTITADASTDVVTATGHTFVDGDSVTFSNLVGGAGLDTITRYFVRDISGDTFKVSTTAGGSATNITTNYTGGTVELDVALVIGGNRLGAVIVGSKPDLTTLGGNARGSGAVDLQQVRSAATHVASGTNALLAGGRGNTASGLDSVVLGGNSNTASAYLSAVFGSVGSSATGQGGVVIAGGSAFATNNEGCLAIGTRALADRAQIIAQGAGHIAATGDAQRIHAVLRGKTTSNTAVELLTGTNTNQRLTIPSGKVMAMIVNITGVKSDGSAVAHYVRQYAIKNVGGTTSEVYAPVTIGTDNAASTSIAVEANDTNDALRINVTGIASETWRWVASVDAVEVAYGT